MVHNIFIQFRIEFMPHRFSGYFLAEIVTFQTLRWRVFGFGLIEFIPVKSVSYLETQFQWSVRRARYSPVQSAQCVLKTST